MTERMGVGQFRELGNELRQFREGLGIPGYVLAERLGWSATKVSRIENGLTSASEIDVLRYAAHCGVGAESIDGLLEMCREPGTAGYWMSNRLSTLILHETTAASSASYDPLVIPGLLQTHEYATELITATGLEDGLVEYFVDTRMERQCGLHGRPFEFYIHEQVLRLPVGGNTLMNEQLLKLVLLAEQSHLTIRVVPMAMGARSMFEGEFVVFSYVDRRPLVYLPSVGLYLDEPGQVSNYQEN
ncbi:MAG TPA: helix-turn-helix transcriptional regulator [Actinophytocola sp.]|uniref:helix-turn-helix domain-containing protein n=1 Tax=Actinophytocola sp. TaxID=1872138 RepID=UPI002E085EEB|nr:helix-turn-helix transcriptional regulator [Actinophytocola sp.]